MKKNLLLLAAGLLMSTGLFAQANPDALKNEGNEAFNAKNYAVAFEKFSEYLKLTNKQDSATAFYNGIAAASLKKYDEAVEMFDIAIAKNFDRTNAYLRKAAIYNEQGNSEKYLQTLEEGLKADSANANLVKAYAVYHMKAAVAAQKAGKADEAKANFEKVSQMSDKKYAADALYRLGLMSLNEGSAILKKATPLAATNAGKYNTEKEKAMAKYKEAKEYLSKGTEVDPGREDIKKVLTQVEGALK